MPRTLRSEFSDKAIPSKTQALLGRLVVLIEHRAVDLKGEVYRALSCPNSVWEEPDFKDAFPFILEAVKKREGLESAHDFAKQILMNAGLKAPHYESGNYSDLQDICEGFIAQNTPVFDTEKTPTSGDVFAQYRAEWQSLDVDNADRNSIAGFLLSKIEDVRHERGLAIGIGMAQWAANWLQGVDTRDEKTLEFLAGFDQHVKNNLQFLPDTDTIKTIYNAEDSAAILYRQYVSELDHLKDRLAVAEPLSVAEFEGEILAFVNGQTLDTKKPALFSDAPASLEV